MNRILASSKAAPKPVFSGSSYPISTATGRHAMIGSVLVNVARLDGISLAVTAVTVIKLKQRLLGISKLNGKRPRSMQK